MPAVSKAQLRYAYAVSEGKSRANKKTKAWAKDVTAKTGTTKGLPEKVKAKKPARKTSKTATRRAKRKK